MARMMEMISVSVKRKGPMQNPYSMEPQSRINHDQDPLYPPRFTPPHSHVAQRGYTQGESKGLEQRPMPFAHLVQGTFMSNPGTTPANPVVPDLDDPVEIAKLKIDDHEAQEKYRNLEEKLKAIEDTEVFSVLGAK